MSDPALPAKFGRYTLLERVGGGGMATVYRAALSVEGGFEKELALKMVRPELATEPRFVEMFLDEARLSARLGHANLVQTFDFGQVDGRWFLAMEFVRGPTLAALLRICRARGIPLGAARSVHVVGEVARGLGYAHRLCDEAGRHLGLVHRDVSPQNVLLSREGEVKLADFGIAKAASRSTVTRTGHVRGKCAYMAPEQARGEALDARTDVFALGIVLWECLAARPLFDGASDGAVLLQVIQRPIPPPSRFAADVPPELDDLVLRMLARDRTARPANGDEVAREIAALKLRIVRAPAEIDLAAFLRGLGSGTAPLGAPVDARHGDAPASVKLGSSALVEVPAPPPEVDPAAETVVRRRPAVGGPEGWGGADAAAEDGLSAGTVGRGAFVAPPEAAMAPSTVAPPARMPSSSSVAPGPALAAASAVARDPEVEAIERRPRMGPDAVGGLVGGSGAAGRPAPGDPMVPGSTPPRPAVGRPRRMRAVAVGAGVAACLAIGIATWVAGAGDGASFGEAPAVLDTSAEATVAAPAPSEAQRDSPPVRADGHAPGERGGTAPEDPSSGRAAPSAPGGVEAVAGAAPPPAAEDPRRDPTERLPATAAALDRARALPGAGTGAAPDRTTAAAPGADGAPRTPHGEEARREPRAPAVGRLIVTSGYEGVLAVTIDGGSARQLRRWVPAEFEIPAGRREIVLEPPASHRRCRVRAEIPPGGQTSLAVDPRGVFRLAGLERQPVPCLD